MIVISVSGLVFFLVVCFLLSATCDFHIYRCLNVYVQSDFIQNGWFLCAVAQNIMVYSMW